MTEQPPPGTATGPSTGAGTGHRSLSGTCPRVRSTPGVRLLGPG